MNGENKYQSKFLSLDRGLFFADGYFQRGDN